MKTVSTKSIGSLLLASGMILLLSAGCGSEGPAGDDGKTPEVSIEDATADQCPGGGKVVTIGDDELVVCNGEDGGQGEAGPEGTSVALRTTEIEAGEDCEHGGFLIEHGPDENGNGVLDEGEEAAGSSIVCNGAPGETPDVSAAPATSDQCSVSEGVVITIDGQETVVCFEEAAIVTVTVDAGCSVPAEMAGTYVEALDCTSDEVDGYDAHCFRHESSEWRIANTGCGWEIGRVEQASDAWERYARSYTGVCSNMTPADHDPATALDTDTYYNSFGEAIGCVSSVYEN